MTYQFFRAHAWVFALLFLSMVLAGCSGGGGNDDSPVVIPPRIVTQPSIATVAEGASATFTVVAAGTAPLSYQWRRNGADISGATAASFSTGPTVAADNGARFSVVASNSAGQAVSSEAILTVTPAGPPTPPAGVAPVITAHPANVTVADGQAATFAVVATGTEPLTYEWRVNGIGIGNVSGASFTTGPNFSPNNGSNFSVIVRNAAGFAVSNEAVLTVTALAVAPAITKQPASLSVNPGQTANFAVAASGTAPLAFQWMKNNVAIAGATASSYSTPPVAAGDTGSVFNVTVSNSAGTVSSANATLTVAVATVPPTITSQPADALIYEGFSASFSVQASGTAPLAYQWRRNGVNIAGAVANSYTTPVLELAENGDRYQVVVTNAAGSATSNEVTVQVLAY